MAFTDGSADPIRGGGGAAAVWTQDLRTNPVIETVEVGHIATSYMAEGQGLLLALRGIPRALGTLDPTAVKIHIWSDCQPAIELISEGRTGTDNAYWTTAKSARLLLEKHRATGMEISIDWIPAHCGIGFNETADRAAKAAAVACREKGTVGSLPRPHQVIKAAIKRRVNQFELTWFHTSANARRAHQFNPQCRPRDISPALRDAAVGRKMESCIGRLRIGNETGPKSRVRMGMATDTLCRNCGLEDGTAHRLMDCTWHPILTARGIAAARLAKLNRNRYPFTMKTLVGHWGVLKQDQTQVVTILAELIRSVPGLFESFMDTRSNAHPKPARKVPGWQKKVAERRRRSDKHNRTKAEPTPARSDRGQQLLSRYWSTTQPKVPSKRTSQPPTSSANMIPDDS